MRTIIAILTVCLIGYVALGAAKGCTDRTIDVGSDSGVRTTDVTEGIGRAAEEGSRVVVMYTILLADGTTIIDLASQHKTHTFTVGDGTVIPGMDLGVRGMKPGGVRTVEIPWSAGYGSKGYGGVVPPKAKLYAEVQMRSVSRPGVYR